jgi:hypothetical protein
MNTYLLAAEGTPLTSRVVISTSNRILLKINDPRNEVMRIRIVIVPGS